MFRTLGVSPLMRYPTASCLARRVAALGVTLASLAGPALPTVQAQLRAEVVATGLMRPLGVVADPIDPTVHYVLEQQGRIRIVRNGVLTPQDFLDFTGKVSTVGEGGLLGIAFAPDYATSRRLFVHLNNLAGDTVIARFKRSNDDPQRVDSASRFDFQWPSGDRFIHQLSGSHKGGQIAFGPEGYLYIGLGDGSSGDDPDNLAQNPDSLLGKMLRIDADVAG